MPELPDVEYFRIYAQSTCLHQKIETVNTEENRVFKMPADDIGRNLVGNSFKSAGRIGKYLFLKINTGMSLVLHFGMTGYLKYYWGKDSEPDYSPLIIKFDNGYNLAYINIRKLGRVLITDDVEDFSKKKELGPDAMSLDEDEFVKILQKSRGYLKTTLMNQKKIAGLGNVYTDEILYQMGLSPKMKMEDVKNGDIEEIYKKMNKVLTTAINRRANPEEFPENYLIRRRSPGSECGICDGKIGRITVGGRSTYFCEKHQGNGR